ncbi:MULTISPECIES: darcynin family protein [unclassified Streptomyces]|uniref:darcynin family protein n=1 Tax=unclassified Streptomyces TaxID=2593676 RepID=UPI0037FA850D
MTYTILVTCNFAPSWLALSRPERKAYRAAHVIPLFARHADHLSARFHDSESFHAEFSDLILFETESLEHYFLLIEDLRDCPLLTEGHVTLQESFIAIENGYRVVPEAVRRTAIEESEKVSLN